jgi:hypothetical protein
VEGNGQISYDFLTIGLNGPIDPRTHKPTSIPMFPNLVNAQLSKGLKQQIENSDVSSIQLKLRTQVEIDAK